MWHKKKKAPRWAHGDGAVKYTPPPKSLPAWASVASSPYPMSRALACARVHTRAMHTSVRCAKEDITKEMNYVLRKDTMPLQQLPKYRFDDVSTVGHMRLQKERQMLKYYRLLANEFPKLKELHVPFTPPPPSSFLTFKFTHYQGEEHPDTSKVVLTLAVKDLFDAKAFSTSLAKHKFLLLAGPRWQPPHTALVQRWNDALAQGPDALEALCQGEGDLGSVKIASQSFPNEAQNMKWCSDVLDRMVSESHAEPALHDVPLDVRPYTSSNARGGRKSRPTKHDFPKEWLP